MYALIRLHPYVRKLEKRCGDLDAEISHMEATMKSMDRYIKQLEELTGYLRDDNEKLKAHLSGRLP